MDERYCKLTGRRRHRAGWFGKLILQVELTYHLVARNASVARDVTYWRDATIADLEI